MRLGLSCAVVGLLLLCFASAIAQDTSFSPVSEQIPGPDWAPLMQWDSAGRPRICTRAELAAWLKDIRHWREERYIRMGYESDEYSRADLKWTQSSFVQP